MDRKGTQSPGTDSEVGSSAHMPAYSRGITSAGGWGRNRAPQLHMDGMMIIFRLSVCNALSDVDQNLMDRLQRVNSSLHSQISRLQNIRNTIEETGVLAEQARFRVESTEQLIEIASRELEKAKMAAANVVSDSELPVGMMGCWEICSRSFYSTENPPPVCLHPTTWHSRAGKPCGS